MKKFLSVLLSVVLIIGTFACKKEVKVETNEEIVKPTVKIEMIDISDIENGYTYQKITYPKFTIEGNFVLQKSLDELNAKFEKAALEFKANGKDEIREIVKNSSFEGAMYEYSVESNIIREDDKYLSIQNSIYEFYMGAHGSHYIEGDNYDVVTGKKLSLSDMINDKEKLKNQIIEWCDKHNDGSFFDDYKTTIEDKFKGELSLEYIIKDDRLQVIFQEYDIAPYATGPSYVDIKI